MSEQVRRVWISTRAHDRATGEWLTVKGEVVPADDYDALHAEAEALQQKLAAFEELHGGELGLPSEGWPAYHKRKMETLRDLHLGRIDRLCTDLEAARGLLREMDDYLSRRGDGEAIHTGSKFHMAIDTFLTGTQAQEVPDHIAESSKMVEQGERQEVWARQSDLDESDPALFVARERVEESGYTVRLTTVTQPGPDVRGLVSFALELIDGAGEGGSFDGGDIQEAGVRHGLLVMEQREESCGEHCACAEYGFPAECYRLTPALAAQRHTQQGDSHDT